MLNCAKMLKKESFQNLSQNVIAYFTFEQLLWNPHISQARFTCERIQCEMDAKAEEYFYILYN